MHSHEQDQERRQELVLQYLREFRKYGDMLDAERFDDVVAHNLGLKPESDEFREIQSLAEELITSEFEAWAEEMESLATSQEQSEQEATPWAIDDDVPHSDVADTRYGAAQSEEEDVQYITVDFGDMEDDEDLDDDLILANKRLDIQVYHVSNE